MRLLGIVLAGALLPLLAQEPPRLLRPLNPDLARTVYSFPIRAGAAPLRFQINLDSTSTIESASVFRHHGIRPFQTLTPCEAETLRMQLFEYDDQRDLIKHADLNFDGYQDVQLLQYFQPHLGKSLFCIYVWDPAAGRFRREPRIPNIDPVADPARRVITVHEDWQGASYRDSTYRWVGPKLVLIEESGVTYGSNDSDCVLIAYCSKRQNGRMAITASWPIGCNDRLDKRLDCAAHAKPRKRAPSHQSAGR